MKRLFVAAVLGMVCVSAFAQGTVNFANAGIGYSAPDYLSDGITKLEGPQFTAQLMAGPTANALVPVATTPFSTGRGAGYFFGGSQTINTIGCGGIGYFQLNVWNTNAGATFEEARASGLANAWAQSVIFPAVTSGGACCDPPCIATMLVGIPSLILNGPNAVPSLALTRSETNTLLLSWLSPPGAFGIAENPDLNTTNWNTLANTPSNIGTYNQMILPRPSGDMFYRLVSEQTEFSYTCTDGAITIVGYQGPGGAVTIPNTINGLPVRTIGQYAFYNSANLTSVTIPDNVTGISAFAFNSCNSLANVKIGIGVQYIAWFAFSGCSSLRSITIPDSVTGVGEGTFLGCSALTNCIIGNNVTNILFETFRGCSALTNVTIGSNVTRIRENAFDSCSSLKSLAIPDNVILIESYAFEYCSSLTNVSLGSSVSGIGLSAFYYCISLSSIVIPDSVTNIGDYSFAGCNNLSEIYFRGNAPPVGPSTFAGDSATVYYLPGTSGWTTTFGGLPTAPWVLPYPLILKGSLGFVVQPKQFAFIVY